MQAPDVYVAGANIRDIPGRTVNNLLTNVVDNFAIDSLTNETNRMRECSSPDNEIIDSGGYSLLKAKEKGKKVIHDKTKPIHYKGALCFSSKPE